MSKGVVRKAAGYIERQSSESSRRTLEEPGSIVRKENKKKLLQL